MGLPPTNMVTLLTVVDGQVSKRLVLIFCRRWPFGFGCFFTTAVERTMLGADVFKTVPHDVAYEPVHCSCTH